MSQLDNITDKILKGEIYLYKFTTLYVDTPHKRKSKFNNPPIRLGSISVKVKLPQPTSLDQMMKLQRENGYFIGFSS